MQFNSVQLRWTIWFLSVFNDTIQQFKCKAIKLSINKLRSAKENETEVVLRLSSNMIGVFDDKINFSHELSLTDNVH